jgi:hypothetical protein
LTSKSPRTRSFRHRHGNRAVDLDDRRRYELDEHRVELRDLGPVGVLGAAGAGVTRGVAVAVELNATAAVRRVRATHRVRPSG